MALDLLPNPSPAPPPRNKGDAASSLGGGIESAQRMKSPFSGTGDGFRVCGQLPDVLRTQQAGSPDSGAHFSVKRDVFRQRHATRAPTLIARIDPTPDAMIMTRLPPLIANVRHLHVDAAPVSRRDAATLRCRASRTNCKRSNSATTSPCARGHPHPRCSSANIIDLPASAATVPLPCRRRWYWTWDYVPAWRRR